VRGPLVVSARLSRVAPNRWDIVAIPLVLGVLTIIAVGAHQMGNRRMTRLTNAFSKKAENHAHMMAIYFMHYNFVRIHQTLKITPAMAAGVTGKLWEMSDMVKVLEAWEATQS
jgi:hypothetical protein